MRRLPLPFGLVCVCGTLAAGCGPLGEAGAYSEPEPEVYIADRAPPAISGGTLLITRDSRAVAADPDRDRVWVVDLSNPKTAASHVVEIPLQQDDEPGRLVEDAAGRIHVALRRAGAIATIDLASKRVIARRPVCGAPRGIAYDQAADVLHVACATGELVTLPSAGNAVVRSLMLGSDLRDVVVQGDQLLVSEFRSASVLTIDASGQVIASTRQQPPHFVEPVLGAEYEPAVAWRMIALPSTGPDQAKVAVVHQRGQLTSIPLLTGGSYYSNAGCDGTIVHSAVSYFQQEQAAGPFEAAQLAAPAIPKTALPVDVAFSGSSTGGSIAIASAGSNVVLTASIADLRALEGQQSCTPVVTSTRVDGEPTSVAYLNPSTVVVQTRLPATIALVSSNGVSKIPLTTAADDVKMTDTGHDMFHLPPNSNTGIACASCHPEGRDDGRTWNFDPIGPRRTQSVAGGVLATAPFHWDGDLPDMGHLMTEVFTTRMGGSAVGPHRVRAFRDWVDVVPRLPVRAGLGDAAIARGKAIFENANVGCATCHSGEHLTNNENADVGTGKKFQVPSLVGVAARAPFMHTGCAKTLMQRFDPACGGGDRHGHTSQLSQQQLGDLVTYLESL